MAEIEITTVASPAELMEFISFPWKVYQGNRYWVPPLISERKEFLDPARNAFFEHARAAYFIARRKGDPVGTIAAFTNEKYNQFQGLNLGFFGFFEVLQDPEAAQALLKTAEEWIRNAGHDSMLGPAQFSTNDEAFLLIDGYDDPPRALMTYNPPYYKDYLEAAGLTKAMDSWAYSISVPNFIQHVPEKLVRVAEKVRERFNLHIRPMRMKEFETEVERFKVVYNSSWERNWGFVPMTDAEIDHLAASLKPIIDPDLVLMVEADGQVVGSSLSIPDMNQALLPAYPRPGKPEALTMAQLFWNWKVRRKVEWLRVVALGVLPPYRAKGVDALMYLETAKRAAPKGYKWAEMSWILETNDMMNRSIRMLGGEVYKTYRMYEKRVR
ncbi:MAG: N-acetyltransferase [Anaerolineales bacterium]|jgi:GNAT superfamily N-acetyltransferase